MFGLAFASACRPSAGAVVAVVEVTTCMREVFDVKLELSRLQYPISYVRSWVYAVPLLPAVSLARKSVRSLAFHPSMDKGSGAGDQQRGNPEPAPWPPTLQPKQQHDGDRDHDSRRKEERASFKQFEQLGHGAARSSCGEASQEVRGVRGRESSPTGVRQADSGSRASPSSASFGSGVQDNSQAHPGHPMDDTTKSKKRQLEKTLYMEVERSIVKREAQSPSKGVHKKA